MNKNRLSHLNCYGGNGGHSTLRVLDVLHLENNFWVSVLLVHMGSLGLQKLVIV